MTFDFDLDGMQHADARKLRIADLGPPGAMRGSLADAVLTVRHTSSVARYLSEGARMASSIAPVPPLKRDATEQEREARRIASEGHERAWRNIDRALFPDLVITGWETVIDRGGEAVPYTKAACQALLDHLCDTSNPARNLEWVFDEIRHYCAREANFIAHLIPVELVAGNS